MTTHGDCTKLNAAEQDCLERNLPRAEWCDSCTVFERDEAAVEGTRAAREAAALNKRPVIFLLDENGEAYSTEFYCSEACRSLIPKRDHTVLGMDGDYLPGTQCEQCGKDIDGAPISEAARPNLDASTTVAELIKVLQATPNQNARVWIVDDTPADTPRVENQSFSLFHIERNTEGETLIILDRRGE